MKRSEPTFLMSPDDVKGNGATRRSSCIVGSHWMEYKTSEEPRSSQKEPEGHSWRTGTRDWGGPYKHDVALRSQNLPDTILPTIKKKK